MGVILFIFQKDLFTSNIHYLQAFIFCVKPSFFVTFFVKPRCNVACISLDRFSNTPQELMWECFPFFILIKNFSCYCPLRD